MIVVITFLSMASAVQASHVAGKLYTALLSYFKSKPKDLLLNDSHLPALFRARINQHTPSSSVYVKIDRSQ